MSIIISTLVFGLLVRSILGADLEIKVFVDRTTVHVGEQFTLSIELSGSDAESTADPEPPSIEAFARYAGSGTSRSFQFINGRMSSQRTVNYYFLAHQTGTFEIPRITVQVNGDSLSSDPITMEVIQGRSPSSSTARRSPQTAANEVSDKDLFLDTSVNKRRVYQNEPLFLTYRIFTRVNVTRYGVSNMPDRTGFWVEELTKPTDKVQTSTEIINGQQYTVATIQRLALFPTSPGTKVLEPLQLECQVRVRSRRNNLFDDFFGDSLGSTARYILTGEAVEVEVLPLPEAGRPKEFSGAVGQFQLNAQIDKTDVTTNDVVTLKLELKGSGNIRTLKDPSIAFPPGLEAYDPELREDLSPSLDAVRATREYEYLIVPRASGQHRIPPVQFTYFDPSDRQYKTTETQEFILDVARSENQSASGTVLSQKENVRLLAQEIRFLKLDPGDLVPEYSAPHKRSSFWLVLLFPVVALLGATLYSRRSTRMEVDVAFARQRSAGRLAKKHFSAARSLVKEETRKEFYAECGKALRGFAADKLNLPEAGMMNDHLKRILLEREVSSIVIKEYLECIETCDLQHFSPIASTEQEMGAFLNKAETAISALQKELRK